MNRSASDLIARRNAKTIFADIVTQKKNVEEGGQLRVNYITDNTSGILITGVAVGAVDTTVAEFDRYVAPFQAPAPPAATVPAAPTALVGTSASGEILVSFTAGSNGGSAITNYEYSLDDGLTYTALSPASGPISSITITGLTNGNPYSVRIRAVNEVGTGSASDMLYIAPMPAGSSLQLLLDAYSVLDPSGTVWDDTSGKVKNGTTYGSLTWSADNSGSYVFDGSGSYVSVPSGFSNFSAGLTILAFVNFGAVANNWERILDFGTGEGQNNILFTRNGTTSALELHIYNGTTYALQASLANGIIGNAWGFYVGRLNGSSYFLRNQDISASVVSSVLPVTVLDQRTSNYIGRSNWSADAYFEGRIGVVAMYNAALSDAEISAFFDLYKARYFTVPAAPTSLVATAGDGQVSITFTAGASGGSAITNYKYSTNGGASYSAFVPADTSSPVVITGLTNDTTYQIKLRAVNAIGDGAESAAVSATPVSPIPSGNVYTSPTTNIGVDISSVSPFVGGGYSYNFNGTSDYLTVSGDNSWAFGTGDFTIEWFQNQTTPAINSFPRVFETGSDSIGCSIETGTLYPWLNGSYTVSAAVSPYIGSWHHFAIVRRSGTLSIYKNGALLASGSNTSNITDNTSTLFIGVQNNTTTVNTWFGGSITNLRIVKGLAVYTGAFTAPTSALTLTASANPYGGSNTAAIPSGFTKLLFVPDPFPVIDGKTLLFRLEGNNTTSYPGSGTTWFDIDQGTTAYNGTLVNTPTYNSSTAGGVFTFDSAQQEYVEIADNINLRARTGASNYRSVVIWAYIPSEPTGGLFSKQATSNDFDGYSIVFTTNRRLVLNMNGSTVNGNYVTPSTNVYNLNQWTMFTGIICFGGGSGNPSKLYVNTTEVLSQANAEGGVNSLAPIRFPEGIQGYSSYTSCSIGGVYYYNGVLTSTDITTLYNATKSRYGL